jgi:hypothetical protein
VNATESLAEATGSSSIVEVPDADTAKTTVPAVLMTMLSFKLAVPAATALLFDDDQSEAPFG